MDAITAAHRTDPIVAKLISGLTADQRDLPTPCAGWTVHDLLAHMCLASDKATRALTDAGPVEGMPVDYLADGPSSGWATAAAALDAAATPDALGGVRQMPFAAVPVEVPGEVVLSAVTVDHLVHAWDLATASGQPFDADDELVGWALALVRASVPIEGRTGHPFGPVVAVAGDASLTEQLVAYTGRQP
jgi:uncharacterized protein (TIGR03086 family)